MKTINVLPVLPEGWEWSRAADGKWSPLNGALLAARQHMAKTGLHSAPVTGTPPAGAVVWDLQALDYATFQPWAPGDLVVVRVGPDLHDGVFSRYDFELDDPDAQDRRVVVRTWRGEDAYPLADVFPNRDAAWSARVADGLEVSDAE